MTLSSQRRLTFTIYTAYKTPGLQDDESAKAAHQKKCDEWVNFSAFLARCTGAGFYDQYSGVFLYPSVDISLALEKKLPTGSLRACRLMVAAQWILHSGRRIHDSMVEENKKDWDLERWSVWEARLKEIVDGGEGDEEVASVLRRTLAEMTSIDASA